MISVSTYQRVLLTLLVTILFTNILSCVIALATIRDNKETRIVTHETLKRVVELLEVPPSEVYRAVDDVRGQLRQMQSQQKEIQQEIKRR